MESYDYHADIRTILETEGIDGRYIMRRETLQGAVLDHLRLVEEMAASEHVNQVLNANLQSLGEQNRELRAHLDEQRGELIVLELTGRAVLSDRDIDNLVDRVWTRFDEQRAAAQEEEDEDDD